MDLVIGDDGNARCAWAGGQAGSLRRRRPDPVVPLMMEYHDTEWGFGVTDDHLLFEKICLEGFQAGLSWLTILRKRPAFREAFAGFDPAVVAAFDETDITRLLGDAGIVRHQGKIRSTVNNAARALEMIGEHGSLAKSFWAHADLDSGPPSTISATTEDSVNLAKDLKRRGWSFVGPTTVYAFMQAMGLVNDHFDECWVRDHAEVARTAAAARYRA